MKRCGISAACQRRERILITFFGRWNRTETVQVVVLWVNLLSLIVCLKVDTYLPAIATFLDPFSQISPQKFVVAHVECRQILEQRRRRCGGRWCYRGSREVADNEALKRGSGGVVIV